MDCRTVAQTDRASNAADDRDTDEVRSGVWQLLATLLQAPPDESMLERLRKGIHASGSDDPLDRAWQALRHSSCVARPDSVEEEFHHLFIGLGRGELMPYASWYRIGFLMDRPLVELRRDLAALGLSRRGDNREPEDHAASIAESMALLTKPESEFDPSMQASVFREHVDPWMPDFFADLQQAQSAAFYRAVGGLGEAFVRFERRWLEERTAA